MNIHDTIEPLFRFRSVVAVCDAQKQIISTVHSSFCAANEIEAKNTAYQIANRRYPQAVYFFCREVEQISRMPLNFGKDIEIISSN